MPSDSPFSADARALGSTRTLIGVIFWPTAILLFLPSTVAGVWFGVASFLAGVGVLILASVAAGTWLLVGYGRAYFSARTPIRWRAFWFTSAAYNGLIVLWWCSAFYGLFGDSVEMPGALIVGLMCVWTLAVCVLSLLIARREPAIATSGAASPSALS